MSTEIIHNNIKVANCSWCISLIKTWWYTCLSKILRKHPGGTIRTLKEGISRPSSSSYNYAYKDSSQTECRMWAKQTNSVSLHLMSSIWKKNRRASLKERNEIISISVPLRILQVTPFWKKSWYDGFWRKICPSNLSFSPFINGKFPSQSVNIELENQGINAK